ncbi:hypothetical protein EJ03DRAFT_277870 [Teratosphaeria nubilosa]|uniref:Dihydrofolate reductase n=1 Tax=Teratosphaeria nubilosa TaxID=161662 RepID=A0A6G1L2V3_9PEZI|nr:hypothetical protein EJ03DRAFT_277870 [Teratosphaeria nubilosa]
MSLKQIPLTIIVAATNKNGIGNNGGLPWPMLKKEMAYFARVTKRVPMPQTNLEGTRRNVVIMGRKTWDSIPPKFRPLKDRTNIIISTQDRSKLGSIPNDVVVASNISSGLEALEKHVKDGKALPVGRAFVIGGSSIYDAALKLPQTKSILLTRIKQDFDCDTVFPEDVGALSSSWRQSSREDLERFVAEEVPSDGLTEGEGEQSTSYEFHLYQRS